MVATVAAGTSAAYYFAQVEYYLGGGEPPGRRLLAGSGLSVAAGATVERAAFERGRTLLANDGGRPERVGGYDVTFSAPKSVNLLWALGDSELRAEIETAQEHSVAAAIEFKEENAAFCRRSRGGGTVERVTLTVGVFRHGEARPALHEDGRRFADPALHHHAVVINAARRADGTIGALDGKALFAFKIAAGAVGHAELACGLQALGFAVDITGPNGTFEVAGVDPELCRYFSARRREIEEELAAAKAARRAAASGWTRRQVQRSGTTFGSGLPGTAASRLTESSRAPATRAVSGSGISRRRRAKASSRSGSRRYPTRSRRDKAPSSTGSSSPVWPARSLGAEQARTAPRQRSSAWSRAAW